VSFEVKGILEGYYGRPWSWSERHRMIDFAAANGFNLYFYCPKNDPVHRNRWREPYLPEEVDRFAALGEHCRQRGVEFLWGLSPLEYHYSDTADLETVLAKLRVIQDRGIESFSLLLDDMPETLRFADDQESFQTLAAAQAWLNNTVLERLRDTGPLRRLAFCPTEYHGKGVSPYLSELGEKLNEAVDVFWTGPQVTSEQLTLDDARTAAASLRRKVIYWDNYPVNDLDMRYSLHLRPLIGRDPLLEEEAKGLVAALGTYSETAKVPLHTIGAYLRDPLAYDPEADWQDALVVVARDPADASAVAVLGDLARRSPLEVRTQYDNALLPILDRFWARWGGPPEAAGPDLPGLPPGYARPAPGTPDRLAAMAKLEAALGPVRLAAIRLLGHMENGVLQAELRPWAEKLSGWFRVMDSALAVLRVALVEPDSASLPVMREAALDRLLLTRENFHWVAGDMFDQFARRCLWAATELTDAPAPRNWSPRP
jgi:hyaluronoglucosaminidase